MDLRVAGIQVQSPNPKNSEIEIRKKVKCPFFFENLSSTRDKTVSERGLLGVKAREVKEVPKCRSLEVPTTSISLVCPPLWPDQGVMT